MDALLVGGASAADADLVRICQAFAEAEWRNWWRYVTTPDHLADAQARDPDWTTLERIQTTPATTPAGWHAKALALAAWDHAAYDDEEAQRDGATTLLAALLRDMVAPARTEILARCAAEYGPLPEGYTEDGRWIGHPPAVVPVTAPLPLHVDVDLLAACVAFKHAEVEVTRLERTADDDVFEPAVAAMHAAAERVSGLRARTVGGLRAKAVVCRAVLAAEEPRAAAGAFGNKVQRHDVLAWSTLADLVEVAG